MIAFASLLLLLPAKPVLEFPEPGLDDTSAYRGYRTRFFRDGAGNAVQIALDARSGRVVLVWADSADESAAFTARDTTGAPATLEWGSAEAQVSEVAEASQASKPAPASRAPPAAATRSITWHLRCPDAPVALGHFALGSMRWERDLQYHGWHLAPFDSTLPVVPEMLELWQRLARLDPAERARHLALLGDSTVKSLGTRLQPSARLIRPDTAWIVVLEQPSLDAKHRLVLELRGNRKLCAVDPRKHSIVIRPRAGKPFTIAITVRTDAAPLTPLPRDRIFDADFLAFCDRVRRESPDSHRARRLERELRGMELLSHEEKLLAGLPNFATYFGRDMLMTALMMEDLWRPDMLAHVVGSALAKLSPAGEVSHEEALGGQAIRESAAEYAGLLARAERAPPSARDSLLARARGVLAHLDDVREGYHMVDESLQLPVVAARYLARADVPDSSKLAFLRSPARPGRAGTRLEALLLNHGFIARQAAPYARSPDPTRLVAFKDDPAGGVISGSWRDSRAGYGGGRFAMDVNVLWMPEALRSIEATIGALARLGFGADTLVALARRAGGPDTILAEFVRDPAALITARERWAASSRWFDVRLPAATVRERLAGWLAWLPEGERAYWRTVADSVAAPDTIRFLALSLDERGQPIPVMNSDVASVEFVSRPDARTSGAWIETLMRPYPLGLFVPRLGILAANDAFAADTVRDAFRADTYHSPRVVWGREVNLLVLALARRMRATGGDAVARAQLERLRAAAADSGFEHAELWSYRIERGVLLPERYGISSDVQLWSLADLAVQYALGRDGSGP